MMPPSSGCNLEVVFGGRNFTSTLVMSSVPAVCAGQLSIRSSTLRPVMHVENQRSQSLNNVAVIHAFVFARYSQPSDSMLTFLKQRGRANLPMIHSGSFSEPVALVHATTVRRCLSTFLPSSCLVAKKRLACIRKKRPVSSTLNTSSDAYDEISWRRSGSASSTVARFTEPLSPCATNCGSHGAS